MAKFCIYCDRPILDGKPCPCRATQQHTTVQTEASEQPTQSQKQTKTWTQSADSTQKTAKQEETVKHTRSRTSSFDTLKAYWNRIDFASKAQHFWQNLTEFIYQPTQITMRIDSLKSTSPLRLILLQMVLIYLWSINFLHNTNLGHFLRYTEKTYLESEQNFTSRIAVNIVFILFILHLSKFILTYICLRIQHYHVTWRKVYRLGLPSNVVATLAILVSFLFLYGSGFISLGILLFACIASACLDYITFTNHFRFSANKALLFTWILYLLITISVAGAVELMFPHISSFYMNTGISF